MSKCISENTPHLIDNYNRLLKEGFSERNAEIKTAIDEYKAIFNKLNSFKESIGLKLTKEEETFTLTNFDISSLYSKEQKVINAFQNKTFNKLKPYTDVLQNAKASTKDKLTALRGISDQMLAEGTAKVVVQELNSIDKNLVDLIDGLGYEIPKESDAMVELTNQPEIHSVIEITPKEQLAAFKENLSKNTNPLIIKLLKAQIERLENEIAMSEKSIENLTSQDKLNLAINANEMQSAMVISHNFEGNIYKIDFDNDSIEGNLEDVDTDFATDFTNSLLSSVFKKDVANINGIDFYFVKHLKSGKFVIFNENMKFYMVSELPQEVINSKEFKNIENCD